MMRRKSSAWLAWSLAVPGLAWFVGTILSCAIIGIGTTAQARCSDAGDRYWPMAVGAPRVRGMDASSGMRPPDMRMLCNPGFVIGYDRNRGRAAWVAYRLTPVRHYVHVRRLDFRPDPRVRVAAPRKVYWGPEYDRGHLAPNYAMTELYGAAAQRAAFYFSNISPQSQRLNQLLWQRLEEIEIDRLAPRLDRLWVLVGPIYEDGDATVPIAFFRIWLHRTGQGRWQAMAFRVPQNVRGDERLDRFLVSVDAVEQATGLDFFPSLAGRTERSVEAQPAPARRWGFAAYACEPARYAEGWQGRGGIRLDFDRCE